MSEDNNITPIDPFRNFVAEKESIDRGYTTAQHIITFF